MILHYKVISKTQFEHGNNVLLRPISTNFSHENVQVYQTGVARPNGPLELVNISDPSADFFETGDEYEITITRRRQAPLLKGDNHE